LRAALLIYSAGFPENRISMLITINGEKTKNTVNVPQPVIAFILTPPELLS
jgi:hypothetical protein